jgi:single-strand DNA-binding protein
MLNNVNLLGRLTADPVLRYTHTSSIPVASFAVAVNRRKIKDKDQATDFFNIVAWKGTAEFVFKNFTKGQPICLQGRLQQRSWTDEATGNTRYAIEVVADSVHFAGFKKDEVNGAENENAANYETDFDPYAVDAA